MKRVLKETLIGVACLLVTVYAYAVFDDDNKTFEKSRLAKILMKNLQHIYGSEVDPGKTTVNIGLSLTCAEYDNNTRSVTANFWEFLSWNDPRLKWNATDFSGVDSVRIPSRFVWKPDTRVFNAFAACSKRDYSINVVLSSDGTVLWIPPATYCFHCKETENGATCKMRIGSWTYDSNDVDLKERDPLALDLDSYDDACPWVVTSHTAKIVNYKYPCCEERYPSLDVTFELKRRSD